MRFAKKWSRWASFPRLARDWADSEISVSYSDGSPAEPHRAQRKEGTGPGGPLPGSASCCEGRRGPLAGPGRAGLRSLGQAGPGPGRLHPGRCSASPVSSAAARSAESRLGAAVSRQPTVTHDSLGGASCHGHGHGPGGLGGVPPNDSDNARPMAPARPGP